MTNRVVIDTFCPHGMLQAHCPTHGSLNNCDHETACGGGYRHPLAPGSYLLLTKKDDEWRDEDAQRIVDFLGLEDTAESLDRIGMGILDALAEGQSA